MESLISPPTPYPSHSALRKLHFHLRSAGYIDTLDILRTSPSQRAIHAGSALANLKQLFADGKHIPTHEAAKALAPLDLQRWIDSGLLEQNGDQTRSLFQIQIYDNLLFITDFMPRQHPVDLVLPIGPSGKYLASATIREQVDSALDLGCGCGIQALLMARHAQHVIATDINPRALALTRLNAELNGFNNIEVIEGSYFEPIQGRTFDRITINLPYVFSPESKYIYRDLDRAGDQRIRQTVDELSRHLNEGGYAHIMLNWTHHAFQAWWQPIEEWLRGRNVDAWTLYSKSETPAEYVRAWILVNETEAPDEYKQVKDKWLEWFQAQNIERIASGLMTLRRRTSKNNWVCSVYIHRIANEPLGGYIQHLFNNQDYLMPIKDPRDLLERKLRPNNMKTESQSLDNFTARTTRGFLIQTKINSMTAAVISQLDGKVSLSEAIQKSSEQDANSKDTSELVAKEIYHLINLGMIKAVE